MPCDRSTTRQVTAMPIEPKSVASSRKRARLAEQKGLTSSGVRHPATFKYHSPPNGSASELFLPVISKTHHTAQTFSVKSSVVYYRTDAAAFLVANEIIMRRLRALTGAGEAALDPVLIHKHRARVSPRESWLLPRSLSHCFFGGKLGSGINS